MQTEKFYIDAAYGHSSPKRQAQSGPNSFVPSDSSSASFTGVERHPTLKQLKVKAKDRLSRVLDFIPTSLSLTEEPTAAYIAELYEDFENARGPHSAAAKPVGVCRQRALTLEEAEIDELSMTSDLAAMQTSFVRRCSTLQTSRRSTKLEALEVPAWKTYAALDRYRDLAVIAEEDTSVAEHTVLGDRCDDQVVAGEAEHVVMIEKAEAIAKENTITAVQIEMPDEIFVTPPDGEEYSDKRPLKTSKCYVWSSATTKIYQDGTFRVTHFVDSRNQLLAAPPKNWRPSNVYGDLESIQRVWVGMQK